MRVGVRVRVKGSITDNHYRSTLFGSDDAWFGLGFQFG